MVVSFTQDFYQTQKKLSPNHQCCPPLQLCAVSSGVCASVSAGLGKAACGGPYNVDATNSVNYWAGGVLGSPTCGSSFTFTIPVTTVAGNYYFVVGPAVATPSTPGLRSGVFSVVKPYIHAVQPTSDVPDLLLDAARTAATGGGGSGHYGLLPASAASYTDVTSQCSYAIEYPSGVPPYTLSCPTASGVITDISFVDYGTFSGGCTNTGAAYPVRSSCSSKLTAAKTRADCVGKNSCSYANTAANGITTWGLNTAFGDPCVGTRKRIVAYYTCGIPVPVVSVIPPDETNPEGYAVFFGGESGTLTWSSNDATYPPLAQSVSVKLFSNYSKATPLSVSLTTAQWMTGESAKGGLDPTWAINFTMPEAISSASGSALTAANWDFARTDTCTLRLVGSGALNGVVYGDTPPFLCGPKFGMIVSLSATPSAGSTVAAVQAATSLGLTWTYPAGARANIMGRPMISLVARLTPVVAGVARTPVAVTFGVLSPTSAFGADRSDWSKAATGITSATVTLPTRAALYAGCPALTAALRAAWPTGAQDMNAELLALCALTSNRSTWSLAVAMERRPSSPGFSPAFTIAGAPFAPGPSSQAKRAGETLTVAWAPTSTNGAITAFATLCGTAATPASIITPNNYNYELAPVTGVVGKSSFVFSVDTTNDAHIALLGADTRHDATKWEIVVGAGANTYTTIRTCHACGAPAGATLPSTTTDGRYVATAGVLKTFWISWTADGSSVTMGAGSVVGANAFISSLNRGSSPAFPTGVSCSCLSRTRLHLLNT